MVVAEVGDFICRQTLQPIIVASHIALLVVPHHPNQEKGSGDNNTTTGTDIDRVGVDVVGSIFGQERPGGYESTDIATHGYHANRRSTSAVTCHIDRCPTVAKSTEGECASHDDESRSVTSLWVFRGDEDDVTDDHERSTDEHVKPTALCLPSEVREEEDEKGANDVWRYSLQLELDGGLVRVDGLDDGWRENGHG